MVLNKIVRAFLRIIYLVLFIIVIYQIAKVIVGGTWETENILIADMGIIVAGMFVIAGFLINQSRTLGILEERTKNIGNSLSHLGQDFKNHLSSRK
ncbi:hypothetical protein J4463_01585 [Candidatus Pacearchaeota archaeon]|nr:hypothetical protein [Candidatus Pacearchaeota archaeon]